jgi:hypothetical protein
LTNPLLSYSSKKRSQRVFFAIGPTIGGTVVPPLAVQAARVGGAGPSTHRSKLDV